MADKTLQDYYNKSIIVDLDIKKIFGFENGDVSTLTNYDAIVQSIRNILNTKKGELVGLIAFGSSIHSFLFEPLSIKNIDTFKSTIIAEINIFEPRVTIIDFKYQINYPQMGALTMDMLFTIKAMGGNNFYRMSFLISSSSGVKATT